MGGRTHDELVEMAAAWLRRRHPIVVTGCVSGRETPDAIAFNADGMTVLCECKASRSDFAADKRKLVRVHPEMGMGAHRYFVAPKGLIGADELPDGWGLLETHGNGLSTVVQPTRFTERNIRAEQILLVSLLRRIGQTSPEGVSIATYTYSTGRTATLGVENPTGGLDDTSVEVE